MLGLNMFFVLLEYYIELNLLYPLLCITFFTPFFLRCLLFPWLIARLPGMSSRMRPAVGTALAGRMLQATSGK